MATDMTKKSPMTAYHRAADGKVKQLAKNDALKQALADRAGLLWVDLLIREEGDATILNELFQFHPLSIEDSVSPRVDAAKIDDHGEYIFVIVQALPVYQAGQEMEPLEVDFYLGPNYVVSCHREPLPAIDLVCERLSQSDTILSRGADWLLHGLLDALVDEYLPAVDAIDDTLDGLEAEILRRPDTHLLQQILIVKRNAMRLRRAATPQRDIMNRLSRGEFPKLIHEDTAIYYRDVYDHLVRVEYLVETLRDLADGALNTYLSVVSNRLNEVMKLLTAAATIFLPLTLISGVYGMNFADNQFPGFDESWGFAVVTGFMITLALGMLAYFKYRDWI